MRLWNPATGHPVGAPLQASVPAASRGWHQSRWQALTSASGDGIVRLWNPATGQPAARRSTQRPSGVAGVAFSPRGKLLASSYGDGTVRLWNRATGQLVGAPLHASAAQTACGGWRSAPMASCWPAGNDGTVRLWNPATGQPVGAPLHAQTGVTSVAFSPDGKLLASAGFDGTVRLWHVSLFAHPYAALCADAGPPTPARMEPLRLRRTAAEGLRLNTQTPRRPPPLRPECPARPGISP